MSLTFSVAMALEVNDGWGKGDDVTLTYYGLTFKAPEALEQKKMEHCDTRFQGEGISIDVTIIDRSTNSSETIGQNVVDAFQRCGIDLKDAHGGDFNKGNFRGGFLFGTQPSGNPIWIGALMHVNMLEAFYIVMEALPNHDDEIQEVFNSLGFVDIPKERIVR